ncbi:conserved mitochondrial protein [Rutstroemia sp. NJR-2017a BBW]|nr:conserved mitochondrial protein [Rutstroemia sp. NJR-2017a BBW]
MSKLSSSLKALISAPHARPGYSPAPRNIRAVFENVQAEASAKKVGLPSWLTISTAATMTMNSPDSMVELFRLATEDKDHAQTVKIVEQMREIGLKCIGFNGIPRTINVLGQFRAQLPSDIIDALSKTPSRELTSSNVDDVKVRGRELWDSIYRPFETKLLDKLADSHPDLPVQILTSYSSLFTDPPISSRPIKVGRVLTSLIGITCLRAQTGVGPQVTSHIFGLRKAFEDGTYKAEGEEPVEGGEWLAGEAGNTWILNTVDRIVEAIGHESGGTTFAPGIKAKL